MPFINFAKNSAACLSPSCRFGPIAFFVGLIVVMLLPIDGRAERTLFFKKEVPRITFENISPPFDQYDYFLNGHSLPFEYDASSFSLINAWWLAEVSTLVYSDAAYIWQRLRQAGFKQVQFIQHDGTYGFVAAHERFAIVAFRGSEIWRREEHFDIQRILADLKTNIDIRLSDWAEGERVHSGFKAALEDVWAVLQPEIEKLQHQGLKIWLTGHSLGAALATLAADRLPDVQGLYTFGSPRVGDEEFEAQFSVHAYRVVNGKDVVTSVPAKDPFRHVGERIHIDAESVIENGHEIDARLEGASCRKDPQTSEETRETVMIDSGILIPHAFRDHNPMLYGILLWNALVDSLADENRQ